MALALAGCGSMMRRPVEPGANLAALPTYGGLMVERLPGGETAVLRRGSTPTAPAQVVNDDGRTIALVRFPDGEHAEVRSGASEASAEARVAWEDGALALVLRGADGRVFHTSGFERRDSVNPPQELRRVLTSPFAVSGLPGVYRAELRDGGDARVGWVQVRILPYVGLPRDYDADTPAGLDISLLAGGIALVDGEIAAMAAENADPGDRVAEGGLVP